MKKFIFLIFLFACTFNLKAQDYNPNRYRTSIFPDVLSLTDVLYGEAPQWVFPYWDVDLLMDIYLPDGDLNPKRPLIIFAHSGGFLIGSKDVDNMVAICDSFSQKGYVTASIEYRSGFDPLDYESAERAVYRAVQDGKAAVRYFKENAILYDIDTNYIFFGGMSAGGFIALNVAYMDKESERPESTYGDDFLVNDLECLDCAGNDYPHTSKVRAILDFWGGVDDTTIIEPGDIPMLIMHGENDETVPFDVGPPFGLFTLPDIYGAKPISERAANIGITYELFTSEGPLHMLDGSDNGTFVDPPNSFWSDTLLPETTRFLYELMKPTTVQLSLVNQTICFDETITFLVSDSATSYYSWDFDESSIEEVLNDNTGELTLKFTTAGTYVITVVEFNEILCAGDTLTFNVIVEEEVNADFAYMIDALNAVNFTNESTGATSYEWNFGDGGASDEFSPMHTYLENGVYGVTLISTSDLGCSDTLITTVTIEGLGQNEIITNASIVYPNPFVDELSIKSIGSSSYVSIMNLHGELIYENQFSGLVEISTAYWPSGIYLLQLIQEDGAIANQKLIKL
jgi:hypothetical protein